MPPFRADLHIHSRYSRATSTKLTPQTLAAWAMVKGLDVLGSGDFTHSKWREELAQVLERDEASGLYRVKDPALLYDVLPEYTPPPAQREAKRPPLFMLQGEISSIYKRGGKVRKVHNLVYMPSFEAAEHFCKRLAQIGNLESDGRPIIGLDSRHLLEMVLDTAPNAFMIPAHIWTPWFSLFGSKSGFNSIEECFDDLAPEIFALETGLSSDPDMNRLWSALDRFKLVSNSDAHSGENLGREANLFSGTPSYDGIFHALKDHSESCTFHGTLEFFPEEGKYHLDGHRDCNLVLTPAETKACNSICPVCGKPLTVGVLNRVQELADRDAPEHPVDQHFVSLIPLAELLGEMLHVGSKSRKVLDMHTKAVARFGSELELLQNTPLNDITRFHPLLGEAIARMRRGDVIRNGGYDGEYGTVRVFSDQEKRELRHGSYLTGFATPPVATTVPLSLSGEATAPTKQQRRKKQKAQAENPLQADAEEKPVSSPVPPQKDTPSALGMILPPLTENILIANSAQTTALSAGPGPILVIAGPGTGKTRTLVERVSHLLRQGENTRHILAVTFTRRAASELDERLTLSLGEGVPLARTDTLHALAFELWHRTHDEPPILIGEEAARRVFAEANSEEPQEKLRDEWDRITLAREKREKLDDTRAAMLERYFRQKAAWNLADYTDLLEFWLEQIQSGLYQSPWTHILVDEIQDLSPLQLELIKALLPASGNGFFGIGDPDQSIYGFRGAHGHVDTFLREAWPELETITLNENYRSPAVILHAASALLGKRSVCGTLKAGLNMPGSICLFEAPTAESEAAWVAGQVRTLIGSGSHTLRDSINDASPVGAGELSPGDIAILIRMRSLAPVYQQALARVGIVASAPENEAFWEDQRVSLILREAGRILGISDTLDEERLVCPDKVLARGPLGISAYFSAMPPFDLLFWQSSAFKALCRSYDQYGGWSGLINWINLQTGLELVRNRSERVQIMTLHAAKGLEFKAVFLPALEDGFMPFAGPAMLSGHIHRDNLPPDVDEERRLLYVGITRSRQSLFLSRAGKRQLFGKEFRLNESPFLCDLPADDMVKVALVSHQKRNEKQLPLI